MENNGFLINQNDILIVKKLNNCHSGNLFKHLIVELTKESIFYLNLDNKEHKGSRLSKEDYILDFEVLEKIEKE